MISSSAKTVSITFDDALDSHLDVAVPMLERHGFCGTFFVPLNTRSFWNRLGEWRDIAGRGHELGNHTIFHPAVERKSYITEGTALERYTLDRMRVELETASTILKGVDGLDQRTFAYPCGNSVLGHSGLAKRLLRGLGFERTRMTGWIKRWPWLDVGSSEKSYKEIAARHFLAARLGGDRLSVGSDFPPDQWAVPSISLDGKSIEQIASILDAFTSCQTGWLVFVVHGIGEGFRLGCKTAVFEWVLNEVRDRSLSVKTFRQASTEIYKE